ncbi:MAG: hypothetical protein HQ559_09185 [Lentisphaerae bacterium]|nr:hypothetical protein [Lentisphaerota bacterium]
MNCRKALMELAAGATRSDPSLAKHLDDCPACTEAAALAAALGRSGESLRRSGLSEDMVEETRRRAAVQLAARERRVPARPYLRFPGPALGWAASAAVLVAAAVGYFHSQPGEPVPVFPAATLSPAEDTVVLDTRIADLSTRVQRGMRNFEQRYGFTRRSNVETESQRLRNRIRMSRGILQDPPGETERSGDAYSGGA